MTTFNLSCEAVEATLPDYLDETLEAWVRNSIDEHIGECARCAGLARDLRKMEREAAALPALFPEHDLWPEIAHGIGVPATISRSVAESEPLMASSELPGLTSASLPISEPLLRTTERSLPTTEPSLPTAEPVLSTAEESLAAIEASLPETHRPLATTELALATSEAALPTSEASVAAGEPLPASAEAPVAPIASAIALPERSEKRWVPAWTGLAAAALVLVTAGTTFLLTVRSLGPVRTPSVVTDTVSRRLSSSVVATRDRGIRAAPVGRQQIASAASAPSTAPGGLPSSLTIATTSAAQATRSPDEAVYDKEINMLQAMRRRRKDELDASTAAVIEKNLRIIDSEIAQIRAALQKDPASPGLGDQVARALDMKVELLRRVAMLRSNT
jgi:hypothetical protein